MEFKNNVTREKLKEKGLKVTPQRLAVLEALYSLNNHPTADQIIEFIRPSHPNIATGTVYKVLETFVSHGIVNKILTENDAMRYDGILSNHHHLYSSDSDHIEDYVNEELDELLRSFFEKNSIKNYEIQSIKLHINGKFTHKK